MLLDYNPSNGLYILRAPQARAEELMTEYGLELSVTAPAKPGEAVLFTREPYAAASFAEYGTPKVRDRLAYMLRQIERSWAPSSDRHIDVPEGKELWPFQRASVDYALDRPHTLIADQPGLGKTPIAIAFANEIKAQRILVVCPASIRFQWARRIAEWSTMLTRYRVDDSLVGLNGDPRIGVLVTSTRGVHDDNAWTVVSWNLLAQSPGIHAALAKQQYDLLILDEAHYAKTVDAARTRAIFGGGRNPVAEHLAARAGKILALTGTPLPNRPREAYVLARHLCWESIDFLAERTFNERFNPKNLMRSNDKVWSDERVGRAAELQNRLRGNFMVRHLKRDVMTQLQMPSFDLVRVEETKAVKAALEAERLLDIDPEDLSGADAEVLGHIAEARHVMGVAMAPQIADYAAMLLEGGEDKLVIFAWHIDVLDIIEQKLGKYGVVRVDGRDSAVRKDGKVRKFIERPEVRVILGNILSLGTGTDGLQHVCSHALLAEPDWVHGNNEQCFDRLDRGGQRQTVQGDIFVAPGSLAEKVLAASLRKGNVAHRALDRRVA